MSDLERADSLAGELSRREILRRAAWVLGGAVSAPAALALLQGCAARDEAPAAGWQPKFLSTEEAAVVSAIADVILPRTDTQGALDAGVPAFIDAFLPAVLAPEAQQRFRAGCAQFAAGEGGQAFLERDRPAQIEAVSKALRGALEAPDPAQPRPFILMVREFTLLGFYTSKPGITENMEYQAVPTAYHGCVPVSAMKKPVYWE